MPFAVTCPECDYGFRVPDAVAGKRGKCPKCQAVFVATRPSAEDEAPDKPAVAGDETVRPSEEKTVTIPKPRVLSALGKAAPKAAAAPPPVASSPGGVATAAAPPVTATAPPAKAAAAPSRPAAVTPAIQVGVESGAARSSAYPHRRKRRSSTGTIIVVAGLGLVALLIAGGALAWSFYGDEILAQAGRANDGGANLNGRGADGSGASTASPKTSSGSDDNDNIFEPGANEVEDGHGDNPFERPPEWLGDETGRDGERPTTPEPEIRPFPPEDDPLQQPLAQFQTVQRLLNEGGWRPVEGADYEAFKQLAFVLTVSQELIDEGRLAPAQADRVQSVTREAMEDIVAAPWPDDAEMQRINRLAVAAMDSENPGIYAYGRCVMRPEDFVDKSIDGRPLVALELMGTREVLIVPAGQNASEIRHGSIWLILGRLDPGENFPAFTLPDAPEEPRDGTVTWVKFLLRGG